MKNCRIAYLIILLSSLVFVYFQGGIVPWAIFYFVIFLPILSFINLYFSFRSLTFTEKTNETNYIKGDSIKYTAKLIIDHFLPLAYITLYIETPENYITGKIDKKEIFISSKKSINFTYRVKCQYRGKYEMGALKIEFLDILCLFKLSFLPVIKNTVTIYPRIKKVYEPPAKSMALSQHKLSFFNRNKGDESTINIREYLYGDSSKLIHWKLSAKLDELLIRDKENVLDSQVILALDLKKATMNPAKEIIYEDLLIEEIIASAHYFVKCNIPIDLVFNHNGIQSLHIDSMHRFYKLYKVLAEVPFSDNASLEEVLFKSLDNKEKINTIYVYCVTLRHEIINNLITLRSMGKQVTAKYCFSKNSAHTFLEINGISNEKLEIITEREPIYYEK